MSMYSFISFDYDIISIGGDFILLGPVVTSKSLGKSYLQLTDVFYFCKKHQINTVILCEDHVFSWAEFLYLSHKNGFRPIILFEYKNQIFLMRNSDDLLSVIRFMNNLRKDFSGSVISIDLPKVLFPARIMKGFFKEPDGLALSDTLDDQFQKKLKLFESYETAYSIDTFKVQFPDLGGINALINILKGKKFSESEIKRLRYELEVVKKLNVSNYILNVKNIVDTAKKNQISVGPGRGSAVGSFLIYSLGITQVNPLSHDLLFERFLNFYRKEMPDVDIDVDARFRNKLILELSKFYGKNRVSEIRTYSRYKTKSALKRAGEVIGNLIETSFLDFPLRSPSNIKKLGSFSRDQKILFYISYYLEGLHSARSTHAAGIVISEKDIAEALPIQAGAVPVIEWEMKELAFAGIEKFDILSLDTITFAKDLNIDYTKIEKKDEKTFSEISKGFTAGLFQLDSYTGRKLSVKIRPRDFDELTVLLSINRPGPLDSGMVEEYVSDSSPDFLRKIFPNTHGVLIFQEQIMFLAQNIANFSIEQSDMLRSALSKKNTSKILSLKKDFLMNASLKIGKDDAQRLFGYIENFAQYSFPKSHAVAYSYLTYNLAREKFLNPEKFFLCLIKYKGLSESIINEILALGMNIVAPDLFFPQGGIVQKDFILPMSCIKGIPHAIDLRTPQTTDFIGIFEYLENIGLNRVVIENFIRAGALDKVDFNRKRLLRQMTAITQGRISELEDIKNSIFGDIKSSEKKEKDISEEELILYETESLGYPITVIKQAGLPKNIYKKFFDSSRKIEFYGYHYLKMLIDSSGIYFIRNFSKVPTKIFLRF